MQGVPQVCFHGQSLTISGSSLCPSLITMHQHKVHGCSSGPTAIPWYSCTQLLWRLVKSSVVQGAVRHQDVIFAHLNSLKSSSNVSVYDSGYNCNPGALSRERDAACLSNIPSVSQNLTTINALQAPFYSHATCHFTSYDCRQPIQLAWFNLCFRDRSCGSSPIASTINSLPREPGLQ